MIMGPPREPLWKNSQKFVVEFLIYKNLCEELEVSDLCHHLLQNYLGSLFISLVRTGNSSSCMEMYVFGSPSEEHGVFVKKPGGQATKFPLSADVRSGPEDVKCKM